MQNAADAFEHSHANEKTFTAMLVEKLPEGNQHGGQIPGGVAMLTTNNNGDTQTQFGVAFDVFHLKKLLFDEAFWDEDSSKYQHIKGLCSFFPVRRKLSGYMNPQKGVNGFVGDFKTRLVYYAESRYPSSNFPDKKLTPDGDEAIRGYTQGKNWRCTRTNLLLCLDLISDDERLRNSAKDLKSCVGWQTPKYSGKVYRGALHSPLEIFVMSFKRRFYFPNFVSTSTKLETMFFTPYPESAAYKDASYQNVIFEIDTSEFPNFSTLIQKHQSMYEENENLLSCYNIYEWMGYRVIKHAPNAKFPEIKIDVGVVSLKVLDYLQHHDLDNACIKGECEVLPESWMGKRGESSKSRHVTPATLTAVLGSLWDSYDKTFGKQKPANGKEGNPLHWLNAPYTVEGYGVDRRYKFEIYETPVPKGESLNNFEFSKLERYQEERRKNASQGK